MKQQLTNNSQETLVEKHFDTYVEDWQTIYAAKDLPSLIIQEQRDYVLNYVDTLDLKKGARILDLGCGTGLTSVNLLQRGFIVVGIDVSEGMLDLARKNCKQFGLECNATFQLGNAEQLDLQDDSFDAVIAMGLIEYLEWDRWALQEMHRVLKPGGYLIVTVPNWIRLSYITDPFFYISIFKQKAGRVLKRNFKYISKLTQKSPRTFNRNLYVPSSLRRMITQLDFNIIDSISHGFGPLILLCRSNRVTFKINQILKQRNERKIMPFLSEVGSDYIVLCQKREKSSDISKRQIFADIDKRNKKFESEKKEFFVRRNAWLKKNPEYSHLDLRQLDTLAYSNENVLVISPHPDDEIIGCGGTLIKMLEEGSIVTVLQLTDGRGTYALKDSPEHIIKTIRFKEAKVVAENLGFAELLLFEEKGSRLECTIDNIKKLSDILNRLHPKIIFVPFINDMNPDHIVANEILSKSLESSTLNLPEVNVLSYEVWSFVPPNSFCIIDNQFDKKAEMLMKYRTGMKVVDYVHFCESLNSYHAYNLLGKKGFAEVFLDIDAKTYMELIRGSNISR